MSSKKKFPEGGYYFSKKSYFYAKEDRTTDQASTSKVRLKSGTDNYLDLSFDEASTTSKIQIGQANTAQPNTIEISTVSTTPSMKLTAGTDSLQKMCLAETLKQKLENLCDALTNATLASPMGPLPFNPGLSTLSQIQQFKTDLSQILSAHIKNN
jgi:hypothetical protein